MHSLFKSDTRSSLLSRALDHTRLASSVAFRDRGEDGALHPTPRPGAWTGDGERFLFNSFAPASLLLSFECFHFVFVVAAVVLPVPGSLAGLSVHLPPRLLFTRPPLTSCE